MITATSPVILTAASLDAATPPDAAAEGASSTRLEAGSVVFSNEHWRIEIEASGAISITALATGQVFLAWGDALQPGAPPFEFAGYTTLVLADGTKITLHTAPWDPQSPQTRPDSVLIVSGDYGVQILGLNAGALSYVETQDYGWLMDAFVPDGATVMHNPDGPGLVGDNPQGLWQVLDVPELDGGAGAGFGPLAGPVGQALLNAGGVSGILFMGGFSRTPTVQAFEFDRSSLVGTERHRLQLQLVDGRVQAWMSVHPGVHPSSGAPGCRWPLGTG